MIMNHVDGSAIGAESRLIQPVGTAVKLCGNNLLVEEALRFWHDPHAGNAVSPRAENKVPAVGRPVSAAFTLAPSPDRHRPPKRDLMLPAAIRGDLPKGQYRGCQVAQGETDSAPVRRPSEVLHDSRTREYFPAV